MVGVTTPEKRYFTPYEVAEHNSPDDVWVSCMGDVLDLTDFIKVRTSYPISAWTPLGRR